jgi:hypothetical protein
MSQDELSALQNPDTWEDVEDSVRPAVKSPRAVVSVAFSREDFEAIAQYAKRHGMKTSEFIRRAALAQLAPKCSGPGVVSVTGPVATNHTVVGPPRGRVEVRTSQPPVVSTT